MDSHSIQLFATFSGTSPAYFSSLRPPSLVIFSRSARLGGGRCKRVDIDARTRCNAVLNSPTQELADVAQENAVPAIEHWPNRLVKDDVEDEALERLRWKEIEKGVKSIRSMLSSMADGETTSSGYDTAWVALVRDEDGSPKFPSSLDWIVHNQLPDGSWGDPYVFEPHDRILNTLGCVVALKSWNMHPDKCQKGMSFFKDNLSKLENAEAEHMPIGFEIAFPSLLELARGLDIDVPDTPFLQEIDARRNLKLTRIPKDIMHTVPTTLLHSLEGITGLDWEKLLKLKCKEGSFLFSPSCTAFAYMQTKDQHCLQYLSKTVQRFKGGVPTAYPVDLFEHIWAVDRLQRLGISRYFQPEIKECVNYVGRYFAQDGICWARNSDIHDIDDTAMGFRILRLHGHEVSADVFNYFKKGDEFFCFAGQSTQAVTGMFNVYRASQVLFPGEKILEEAREYSSKFLRQRHAANELEDKWIIMKDLPGEVGFALELPWYAILPRVEARFYIEQYGGEDDVWIGKTLYRMPYVNNNDYLQLAKLDYNNCQALHCTEWDNLQKWYEEQKLQDFGICRRALLFAYFLAAANVFEPERSKERLAWTKTTILLQTIESCFQENTSSTEERRAFVQEFVSRIRSRDDGRSIYAKNRRQELVKLLIGSLGDLCVESLAAHGQDISPGLYQAWEKWLLEWEEEGDRCRAEGELIVQTINLTAGVSELLLTSNPHYEQLSNLINGLCYQLNHYKTKKVLNGNGSCRGAGLKITTPEIESDMQGLVQLVLLNSPDGLDSNIRQTFLAVAKSFYYSAVCDPGTIDHHIAKVLFDKVC